MKFDGYGKILVKRGFFSNPIYLLQRDFMDRSGHDLSGAEMILYAMTLHSNEYARNMPYEYHFSRLFTIY